LKAQRSIGTLLCALALAGMGARPVSADDLLNQIRAKKMMTVGVKTDYPPFGYLVGDKNAGYEIDLVHRIAKDLIGDENAVTFVPVLSANRIQYLQTGKVDFLMATVSVTDARKKIVHFASPDAKSGWTLLVKKGSTIKGVADLAGKNVVVFPGTTNEAGITREAPNAVQVKLNSVAEGVQALQQGRAEAFAMDESLFAGVLDANPGQYEVVGKSYDVTPIAAACRMDATSPCDYVSSELAKFKKDGFIKKDLSKYLHGEANRFLPN